MMPSLSSSRFWTGFFEWSHPHWAWTISIVSVNIWGPTFINCVRCHRPGLILLWSWAHWQLTSFWVKRILFWAKWVLYYYVCCHRGIGLSNHWTWTNKINRTYLSIMEVWTMSSFIRMQLDPQKGGVRSTTSTNAHAMQSNMNYMTCFIYGNSQSFQNSSVICLLAVLQCSTFQVLLKAHISIVALSKIAIKNKYLNYSVWSNKVIDRIG